jgi:hypothetical protein
VLIECPALAVPPEHGVFKKIVRRCIKLQRGVVLSGCPAPKFESIFPNAPDPGKISELPHVRVVERESERMLIIVQIQLANLA